MNEANVIYGLYAKMHRMEFHETKSKYMTTGSEVSIELNNKQIPKAKEYKYLGDIITPDGKLDATIKVRKNAVRGITAELTQIIGEIDQHMKVKAFIQYAHVLILL